jgi:radical SAM protein with 4Fe4S-binding SPASM domain
VSRQKSVLPFFWPPSLLVRQSASALYMGTLVGWRKMGQWFVRSGFKSVPVAAGAYGMGCIGFPAHPVWEVTSACNLSCIHCHASSGKPAPDELNTEEGLRLMREIASVKEFRMLVFTGGEPLVRRDVFDLLAYGKSLGLKLVIATNGTLITEEVAFRLRRNGVVGVAVSLDAADPKIHNFMRNNPKAFDLALAGIANARKAGLAIQINCTANKHNIDNLKETIGLAERLGADIMLVYQLVTVGRGQDVKTSALEIEDNRRLSATIKECQKDCRTIIEPVAGPQYWPYLVKKNGRSEGRAALGLAGHLFHGCTAGRGLVYVKANGDVWPCPFVEVNTGNVREASFRQIWDTSEVFLKLRDRKALKGECGKCRYQEMCGGCRGRAWAETGDYLAEDSLCFIRETNRDI